MIKVSDFYKKLFGGKVYKVSIDAGCTCPNRDGTKGTGGCIFCSATGSGDFAAGRNFSVAEQIEQAKLLVNKKFSRKAARGEAVEKKYIAYFQNFTSTYGDEDLLLAKFREAAGAKDIVGIAIGTRPDCLSEKMLHGLGELSRETFLQVELGFQTANEKTAEYCRRGFNNETYSKAVEALHKAGNIHVVTHVIFGLPGDSEKDMLGTVKNAVSAGTDGIKITVLFVLEGIDIALDYKAGKFKVLEKNEYLLLIKKALELIPENVIIHRLTGDPPKKLLIAPEWTCDKKRVLNDLNKIIDCV